MPIAPQATIDPLAAFMTGAFVAGTANPCPPVATRFDVVLDAGLAVMPRLRRAAASAAYGCKRISVSQIIESRPEPPHPNPLPAGASLGTDLH